MTWGIKGAGTRGLELPAGNRVAVSPIGRARIRYNETSMLLEQSLNGGAWVGLGGGGGGSPAAPNTSVQFNNGGAFGGSIDFTWDGTNLAYTGTAIDLDPTGAFTLDMDASQTVTITVADNLTGAFLIQEGVNGYIGLNTNPGTEVISFGNSTTNPAYNFLGTGTTSVVGRLAVGDIDRAAAQTIDVGIVNATTITMGRSGQRFVLDSESLSLTEQALDPGATLNEGQVYAKDVTAVTELFYQDSAGNVVQITSGGSVAGAGSPGGANTDVQFNNAGAFGGSSNFTWDGTNLAFTGTGIDLDPTGAFTLDMDAAQTATITVADNQFGAFVVQEGANEYVSISTGNGTEFMSFGNATTNPNYNFLGSGGVGIAGNLGVPTIDRGFAATIDIGTTATTTITMGRSGQRFVVDSESVSLSEQALDPGATLNEGQVYAKDVTAVTELFYQDSAGNVVQITSGGSVAGAGSPGGANTDVQFNNAGAFGGSSNFTFDGTDVTVANQLTANTVAVSGSTAASRFVNFTDGQTAAIGAGTEGRLRYSQASRRFEASVDGNAYGVVHLSTVRQSLLDAFLVEEQVSGLQLLRISTFGATNEFNIGGNAASEGMAIRAHLAVNNTSAYRLFEQGSGVDTLLVSTQTGSERIDFGNTTDNTNFNFLGTGTLTIDGALDFDGSTIDLDPTGAFTLDMDASQTATITVADNLADALLVQEGANDYLALTTVNTSEAFDFGNTTTNPEYHFLGTGLFTMGGQLDINGSIQAPSAQPVEIGSLSPTTGVNLGRTGQSIGFFSSSGTTQQTITGSRGGNAALASLLTALAAHNFIVDSSS